MSANGTYLQIHFFKPIFLEIVFCRTSNFRLASLKKGHPLRNPPWRVKAAFFRRSLKQKSSLERGCYIHQDQIFLLYKTYILYLHRSHFLVYVCLCVCDRGRGISPINRKLSSPPDFPLSHPQNVELGHFCKYIIYNILYIILYIYIGQSVEDL